MHRIQISILELLKRSNGVFKEFSYRSLGEAIHIEHAQQVKHHVQQLEKRSLIVADRISRILRLAPLGSSKDATLETIPIIGAANCGQATLFAQENLEGTLKISKKLISNREKNIFAIRAVGSSMNRARVNGVSIDEGDYVVVDKSSFIAHDGDYVLVVIDDFGVVKKFVRGKGREEIELVSESTEEHPPIHIHQDDQFIISGKVIYVVKKAKPN